MLCNCFHPPYSKYQMPVAALTWNIADLFLQIHVRTRRQGDGLHFASVGTTAEVVFLCVFHVLGFIRFSIHSGYRIFIYLLVGQYFYLSSSDHTIGRLTPSIVVPYVDTAGSTFK